MAATTAKADTDTPQTAQDDQLTYDAAGQITRILDAASAVPGSTPGQSECFSYDGLDRLAAAFTTTASTCTAGTNTGGADPYNQTYTYDAVGNIKTLTDNGVTGTYAYPAPGASAVRPNAVTSISRPTGTDTYGYDNAGQLTARTVAGKQSTFTWNPLGQLDKAIIDGQETSMMYDAAGERLLRRDPDGTTTLYLGSMEIKASSGQASATRYYTSADRATIALRNASGITWLGSGLHGSTQVAIHDTSGTISRDRYLPYGQRRGEDDLPFTDRGFLGKTEDTSTGLIYLGARYYDPSIAKFVSTDPLLAVGKPQWINPYSYAGNNPIGLSDPEGLIPDHGCTGGERFTVQCKQAKACAKPNSKTCKNFKAQVAEGKRRAKLVLQRMHYLQQFQSECLGSAMLAGALTGKLNTRACATLAYLAGIPISNTGKIPDYWRDMHWAAKLLLEDSYDCVNMNSITACMMMATGGAAGTAKNGVKVGAKGIKEAFKRLGKLFKKCSSFVPGTLVLMANGTHKRIEDLKVGDKVRATDPVTGRTTPETVLATITSHGDKQLVRITVDTDGDQGKGTGMVISTAEHPFWVIGRGDWVSAANLHKGMKLRDVTGDAVTVIAVSSFRNENRRVHNLTVENVRTYYVAAAETDLLVHNCPPNAEDADEAAAAAAAAAKRADERFAAKNSLNADSDIVQNRTMTVSNFIATFRKGSIKSVMPSEYLEMTVEEALKAAKASKDTTVRKLLTDNRFKK
ncbi:RHS repeat-associated core domain-containing protein [Nonomuraea sp. 3N208]|uniref:RHS repeat-associated core domain-containing protein n=1 Tax=Nonomuraea sp. 3N208 TaxID=3457421 RepID=UPI003FCC8985